MNISLYLSSLIIRDKRVFDPIRKKWLIIQPEELVRQALLLYLIEEKGMRSSRIAVEKSILFNGQLRRFDIVYYDGHGNPVLLVECKAPDIAISQSVLEQAAWYNFEIKAPYLLLSNGHDSHWYEIDPIQKSYIRLGQEGPNLQ